MCAVFIKNTGSP